MYCVACVCFCVGRGSHLTRSAGLGDADDLVLHVERGLYVLAGVGVLNVVQVRVDVAVLAIVQLAVHLSRPAVREAPVLCVCVSVSVFCVQCACSCANQMSAVVTLTSLCVLCARGVRCVGAAHHLRNAMSQPCVRPSGSSCAAHLDEEVPHVLALRLPRDVAQRPLHIRRPHTPLLRERRERAHVVDEAERVAEVGVAVRRHERKPGGYRVSSAELCAVCVVCCVVCDALYVVFGT